MSQKSKGVNNEINIMVESMVYVHAGSLSQCHGFVGPLNRVEPFLKGYKLLCLTTMTDQNVCFERKGLFCYISLIKRGCNNGMFWVGSL